MSVRTYKKVSRAEQGRGEERRGEESRSSSQMNSSSKSLIPQEKQNTVNNNKQLLTCHLLFARNCLSFRVLILTALDLALFCQKNKK